MSPKKNYHSVPFPAIPKVKKLVTFDSKHQLETIHQAAARRGLSFSAFVRAVAEGAASEVLKEPPEQILGEFLRAGVSALDTNTNL